MLFNAYSQHVDEVEAAAEKRQQIARQTRACLA